MEVRYIAAGVAVAVPTVLLVWNTWTLTSLNARVSGLELGMQRTSGLVADMELLAAQRSAMRAEPISAAPSGAPRAAPGRPSPELGAEVPRRSTRARTDLTPEDRDERYERIASQWVAGLELEVEAFATEYDLDEVQTDEVLQELEVLYETLGAVRQDVVDGTMTLEDAKVELKVVKEDADRRLRRLLGPERHAALQVRLRDR